MQLQSARWAILALVLNFSLVDGQLPRFLRRLTIPQFYAAYEAVFNSVRSVPNLRQSKGLGKLQPELPDMVFPCDVTHGRSPRRPSSVHALRPGDIDVIGAIGDSLTAGSGALASDVLHVVVANRGVSFSIGGEADWRTYLTLPNILKVYNPNLIGYSLGDAVTWDRKAQFNVAEPGAMSADLHHQAKNFVKRMKSDSRVNFREDWKLVTLFIGANDFCLNSCFIPLEGTLQNHQRELQQALDYLYQNVPRLIINVIPVPNLKVLINMVGKSPTCVLSTTLECPCLIGLPHARNRNKYIQLMDDWQQIDIEMGNSARYRGREDFTVIVQPFSTNVTFPTIQNPATGKKYTDFSYLSADCFHFSQKGDAISANALWNNMFEPVGRKSTDWTYPLFKKFLCPTAQAPYIFTHKNSAGA